MTGYVVEPLADEHDLTSFECGRSGLTSWLQSHSQNAVGQGTRTYVLIQEGHPEALGYFVAGPPCRRTG